MSVPEYVSRDRRGPVEWLIIRRPDVHNAFNEHVIAQLADAFDAVARSRDARVVVLSGEGRSFSAGADLDWMRRAASFTEEENRRDATALAAMLRAVSECPCPVVARVHGSAFGGGAGLTAAADIVIAGESARFAFTEVRLGIVPATIARHVLRRIAAGRALPLFLTGERISADRAFHLGLVDRVVPDDQLDAAVDAVVGDLLAGGPQAQAHVKQLVRRVGAQADDIDAYAADLIARVRAAEEGREGVAAFLEKRAPRWAQPRDD